MNYAPTDTTDAFDPSSLYDTRSFHVTGNHYITDRLGLATDITADGSIVVIGGPGTEDAVNQKGAVRIMYRQSDLSYTLHKMLWHPQVSLSVAVDANFGASVSITPDGTTLAVAHFFGQRRATWPATADQVFIYYRDAGGADNWGLVATGTTSSVVGLKTLGTTVLLRDDGQVAFATVPSTATPSPPAPAGTDGMAFGGIDVFGRDHTGADAWGRIATLLPGTVTSGDPNHFGTIMASVGNWLFTSWQLKAGLIPLAEHVLSIYHAADGISYTEVSRFTGADLGGTGTLILPVSFAAVDDLLVVSCTMISSNAHGGLVFLRKDVSDNWSSIQVEANPNAVTTYEFGQAVALSRDPHSNVFMVVTDGGTSSEIEIFTDKVTPYVFAHEATVSAPGTPPLLTNPGTTVVDYGQAISASSNTIVVGRPTWTGPTCNEKIRPPTVVAGEVIDDNDKDVIVSPGDTIVLYFAFTSNGGGFGSSVLSRADVDGLLEFVPPLAGPDGDYTGRWMDPGVYSVLNISIAEELAVRVIGTSFLAGNGTSFPPDPNVVFDNFVGSWGTGAGVLPGEYPRPQLEGVSPSVCSLAGCTITLYGSQFVPGCSVGIGDEHYEFVSPRLTYHNSSMMTVVTPSYTSEGYRTINVTNLRSEASVLERTMFFTDDCPQPGQFGRGTACRTCPTGAYCPGGFRMWPLPGYWNPNENVGWVERCPEPSTARCLGGATSACAAGYTGDFCAACESGYFKRGGECVSCGADTKGIFAGLLLTNAVFYGAFILAALVVKDRTLSTLSRVIITVQMIRGVAKMNVSRLSPELRTLYSYFALVTMDAEFVRPGCVVSSVFPVLFWANAALLGTTVAAAVLFIALAKSVTHSHRFYRNRVARTLVILLAMMYLSLSTYILRGGYCLPGRDDRMRLVAEPSTVCYEGGHWPVAIVSYVMFFKEGAYWFEFLQFGMYGVLAVCDSILMHEPDIQFGVSLATLSVFGIAVVSTRPFNSVWKNAMEAGFTVISIALVVLNYMSGSLSNSANDVVSTVIVFAFVVGISGLIVMGVVYLCFKRKSKQLTFATIVRAVIAQTEERAAGHDLTHQPASAKVDERVRGLALKMRSRLRARGAATSAAVMPTVYDEAAVKQVGSGSRSGSSGGVELDGADMSVMADGCDRGTSGLSMSSGSSSTSESMSDVEQFLPPSDEGRLTVMASASEPLQRTPAAPS
ncbi:uncharacterized protein AMSG_11755 [Thecamonas trahens ATCC 50062]|uniref:IPT/TIG domain-containing protein n=1 Tax=Thecamonas trahens ATCC 50062 TaxID=461836 RepID=A0A0L0D3P1_THETB|nr:hypothetical protein AMSG_11755 [Thecamonas trahens ATCC 50062]KNC46761.1 hypothetical protein AMSG_11755 [Thecamonas trahens ATCC 50062]|eukprot:XP_013760253.1 hypothetical protein AMSG_11755 [Thecamonas trahens ATCC 50062]